MGEELKALYTTLGCYKKSIINNFDKIDSILLEDVNDYEDSNSRLTIAMKYDITKNMVEVLRNYMKILFLSESTLEELERRAHRNSAPVRDKPARRDSNPFRLSEPEAPEYSFISPKTEIVEVVEEVSPSDTIVEVIEEDLLSDTNTVVEVVQEDLPTDTNSIVEVVKEELLTDTNTSVDFHDTVPPVPVESEGEAMGAVIKMEEESPVKETVTEVETVESVQVEQPLCESDYSATVKLLKMNVHDRRREAEKRFASKNVVKDFKWKVVQSSPISSPDKKKKSKKWIFDIKDDDLAVNQMCVFSCVATPMEFYLQTNQELLESLEGAINEDMNHQHQYVVSNFKSKEEAKATVGNFGFVFMPKRRKWYRVRVTDWMENEVELILVQLIDHGEKFMCRYERLKCMTQFYSQFPKMAVKCHFAGIHTPDGLERYRWPQESIDALIEMSEMERKSTFSIIYLHKEGDSYAVDLMKADSDMTLGELLVERGLAKQEKVPNDRLSIISEEDDDDDLEEYNINEVITGYDAQDEARICPFTDDSGRCFKGPSCKLEHSKLSTDGVTTDKALVAMQALTELVLPPPGELIEILITGYINTCHFYAHIIRERTGSSLFNDDFQKLQDQMNSNNIVHTYEPFKIYPAIGEVVLLKHEQQWHRATCVEHLRDNTFVLFVVDLGQTVTKKLSDIRQIKDEFLYLAFQAVECMLESCRERPDVSPESSMEFFDNCMRFKLFKGYVTGGKKPLRLKLFDDRSLDLDYVLKEFGLGEDRDHNMFPNESALLQLA